jgi:hypothetical protein
MSTFLVYKLFIETEKWYTLYTYVKSDPC